jgi:DNA-binding transcriptional regulator YiaG
MMTNVITIQTLSDEDDLSKWHHFTSSGLDNYWLSEQLFNKEEYDGDIYYSYPQYDNIMAAIGVNICELPRILGPKEIKFLRAEMDMPQATLAAKLGYTDAQPVSLAESLNTRHKPLPRAEDAWVRKFYLETIENSEDVADYLREKANKTNTDMDAQHTTVVLDSAFENLLVA